MCVRVYVCQCTRVYYCLLLTLLLRLFFVCLLCHNTRINERISLCAFLALSLLYLLLLHYDEVASQVRVECDPLSLDGQGNNNMLCTHWFCNLLCCCLVVYVCCAGFLLQFIIIYCLFCFWCGSHTHTAIYTCIHIDIQILWLQCCLWRAAHLC